MAITRERKEELAAQYQAMQVKAQAAFVTEYVGLTVKAIEDLRRMVREKGGEFHVAKNTLIKRVYKEQGYDVPESLFDGSTAVGFAYEDAPALAKVLSDFARTSDALKIKGGFLGKKTLGAQDIKALADLPPLPVVRSQLIGIIQAPASKIARTLAEPGRMVAAVVQAHASAAEAAGE